jgi:hypothetical protein
MSALAPTVPTGGSAKAMYWRASSPSRDQGPP